MELKCPFCHLKNSSDRTSEKNICKAGSYYRSSDRKRVQRYVCRRCGTHFSSSTLHDCYKQKKRHINGKVARELVGGVSLRESARILKVNRKTIVRKMKFMAGRAEDELVRFNSQFPQAAEIQFDEMETFEHTKCKPVSIIMAVESKSRRILGFEEASMPCKGRLSAKSLRKYGKRADDRGRARQKLFETIKPLVTSSVQIKSDDNPHYPSDVKKYFPQGIHIRIKGGRSCSTGQGELKRVGFDPIFSFNHTAAMVRYRLSRMIRKTWCTSKNKEGIRNHLMLMAIFHNKKIALKNQQNRGPA